MSYANKILDAIEKATSELLFDNGSWRDFSNTTDYKLSKIYQDRMQELLGLRVLVQTDYASTDARPSFNITVWSEKGREIKNPKLRGSGRVNYFYS